MKSLSRQHQAGDEQALPDGLPVGKEIEELIVTGATTGTVGANNSAIKKNIRRTTNRYRNPANFKTLILLRSAQRRRPWRSQGRLQVLRLMPQTRQPMPAAAQRRRG